ncbi:MAG: DsrE family protein [Pseudomonadota bacterium]
MPLKFTMGAALILATSAIAANAQPDGFHLGPLIEEFGPVATIEGREPIPADAEFKVSFDVVDAAEPGELNRSFVAGARFLNMHAEAGVAPENINLAFVIHGTAVHDVTRDAHYEVVTGSPNANRALIEQLTENGVSVQVCGQSAAYHGVETEDLLPGVTMSLSAMTAHALLQQDSYTLNPF